MPVIECPNCGKRISIPETKPTEITCSDCEQVIKLRYSNHDNSDDSSEESVKPPLLRRMWNSFGNACMKVCEWADDHPKTAAAIVVVTGFIIDFLRDCNDAAKERTISSQRTSDTEPNNSSYSSTMDDNSMSEDSFCSSDPTNYETRTVPVRGTRVHLSGNRHPSAQKRADAAENGYPDLGENETWRVPSSRGIKVPSKDD